jgi:phosphoesterase RecJ-like protein
VRVSWECAYNLYVAISTDTGSFRYESTTSRTLRIAAELIDHGVRPEIIAGHLHDNFTIHRLKLMEMVLGTLRLHESGKLAFITVTTDMFDKSGASVQDVEGFIDYPRSLRSVKVAAFLKEGKKRQVSVSLRSKGECDVAEVAQSFGGGGHRNAAGFRFSGKNVEQVYDEVLEALKTALNG